MGSQQADELAVPSDINYFRFYDNLQKEIVKDAVDPTPYLDKLEQFVFAPLLAEAWPHGDHHKKYFLNTALVRITKNLAGRRFKENDELIARINSFFLKVIDLALHFIEQDMLGTLESLLNVLDENRHFFLCHADALFASWVEAMPVIEEHARRKTKSTSSFLIYNVNYLISRNGLEAMLARIERTNERIPVPNMRAIVSTWHLIVEYLTKGVRKQFINRLQQSVFTTLMEMSDKELRPVKKDDISEIVRCLEEILEEVDASAVHEKCETFCLAFALKCFKSPNLEKRMQGLTYIEEAIDMTRKRKTFSLWNASGTGTAASIGAARSWESRSRFAVAKWMTTGMLLNWIKENEIIESLYDPKSDPHRELIKRSKGLLRFLAEEKRLGKTVIDGVWRVLETDASVMADAVYEVLAAICPTLDEEMQLYIFDKISQLSLREFVPATIMLIGEFAKIRDKMINILWSTAQDNNGATREIADSAVEMLLDKCSYYAARDYLPGVIKLCLHGITEGQSVLQCITVLHRITSSTKHFPDERESISKYMPKYQKKDAGEITRQELLDELIKKDDLLALLCRELQQYMATYSSLFQQQQSSSSEVPSEDIVLSGRHPHLKNIRDRLDFLQFVIDFSSAKLSEEVTNVLWDSLLSSKNALLERRIGMRWFYQICIGSLKDNHILDEQALEHIFKKLVITFTEAPQEVSDIGFDCFQRYMCRLNAERSFLRLETKTSSANGSTDNKGRGPSATILNMTELQGMDCLWQIALLAQNTFVVRDSMEFLVQLYQNIDRNLLDVGAIHKDYVDRCMSRLQDCQNKFGDATLKYEDKRAAEQMTDRLISILKTFLDESKKREDKKNEELRKKKEEEQKKAEELQRQQEEAQTQSEDKPVEAKKTKKPAPAIPKMYEDQVDGLAEMLQMSKIAVTLALKQYNWSAETAAMYLFEDSCRERFVKEAEEYDDGSPSADSNAELSSEAHMQMGGGGPIVDGKGKEKEKEEEEETEVSPALLLANNPAYFDQLFELLNLEHINREKVWGILKQLPTNKRILKTFRTLRGESKINESSNKPNWAELLNPKRMYKMMYSLQIIDSLAIPTENAKDAEILEKQIWCRTFFYAYGFHHMFKMLASDVFSETDKESEVYKSCLALLLKIVHYFMKGGLNQTTLDNIPTNPLGSVPAEKALPSGNADEEAVKRRKRELAFSATTGKKLIDSVDFETFVTTLIHTAWSTCKAPQYHPDHTVIVKYALSLLVASIVSRPDLLEQFYQYTETDASTKEKQGIDQFILNVLLYHTDAEVRRALANGFLLLCTELRDIPAESLPTPPGTQYKPHEYMLELLLAHLPPEGSRSETCEQFFEFLNSLIEEYCTRQADITKALRKFDGLRESTIRQIKERAVIEKDTFSVPDYVLTGLMSLLRTLVHLEPVLKPQLASPKGADMIQLLWGHFLFPPPSQVERKAGEQLQWRETAVCKTYKSRSVALKLLAELANGCATNLLALLNLLFTVHEKKDGVAMEITRPAEKNVSGYVGLRNPGCICYMNSFLQQLYMTPTLRYGLLTAKLPDGTTKEESLLWQLQRMFGHLLTSETQYYDPSTTFIKAFKEIGGNPISLMRQEDASEFVYALFARLETLLKGTEHEKLINNFTGIETQIVRCSLDASHFSESQHATSLLTLSIRGHSGLYAALEAYVQGDKLDDWKCSDCNKVSGAVKRLCFKQLPNTLIVHLKRFDYTIDAMGDIRQYKITDSFEFPMDLDMEPFTKEGIDRKEAIELEKKNREGATDEEVSAIIPQIHPQSYYQYELVGVLVHSGTQEAGHYYSFIKDRTKETSQWYEFNDTYVRLWDVTKRLREECFGGEKIPKSAYMLIYQRKVPEPEDFPIPEEMQVLLGQAPSSIKRSGSNYSLAMGNEAERNEDNVKSSLLAAPATPELGFKKPEAEKRKEHEDTIVPLPALPLHTASKVDKLNEQFKFRFSEVVTDETLHAVWQENYNVARQRQMFEHEYMEYLRDVFALVVQTGIPADEPGQDTIFRTIRLATYYMDTLVRCGREEKDLYLSHIETLIAMFVNRPEACRWFLATLMGDMKQKWLRYHLIDNDFLYVRQAFSRLVISVLTTLSTAENQLLMEERQAREKLEAENPPPAVLPAEGAEPLFNYPSKATSIQFVDYLISTSETTRRAWRRYHQYWWLLREYCMIGYEQRMWLVARGLIAVLVDYYMGPYSPYRDKTVMRVSIGEPGRIQPDLGIFMELQGQLVRATETNGFINSKKRPPTSFAEDPSLAPLPLRDRRLLFNKEYFASMLKQCYNLETNEVIVLHNSWEDEDRSFMYLDLLLKSIHNEEHYRSFLPVLEKVLGLPDSLQQWRCTLALSHTDNGLLHVLERHSAAKPMLAFESVAMMVRLFNTNPIAAHCLFSSKDIWWPVLERWLESKHPLGNYEWMQIENPEEQLARALASLREVWHRIAHPDQTPAHARIVFQWDSAQATEDLARQHVRLVPKPF